MEHIKFTLIETQFETKEVYTMSSYTVSVSDVQAIVESFIVMSKSTYSNREWYASMSPLYDNGFDFSDSGWTLITSMINMNLEATLDNYGEDARRLDAEQVALEICSAQKVAAFKDIYKAFKCLNNFLYQCETSDRIEEMPLFKALTEIKKNIAVQIVCSSERYNNI